MRLPQYVVQHQGDTAQHAGIGLQRRHDDPGDPAELAHRTLGDHLPCGGHQEFVRQAQRAAEGDQLRIEQIDQVGDADAQVRPRLVQRLAGDVIALSGGLQDGRQRDLAAVDART